MQPRRVVLILFVLVALAQLYIPVSMIINKEEIIEHGKIYKFKSQPIDPTDPLRGKYIILNYQNNYVEIPGDSIYFGGQDVFVVLKQDAMGFADIDHLELVIPLGDKDYVKAKIHSLRYQDDTSRIHVNYPFDRYYMEEHKAPLAEEIQNESALDSSSITHVVVKVMDGEAVIQEVVVDGVPIHELLKNPN